MKEEYDFSKGKVGAIDPMPATKTRITIRLDNDIINWFRDQVNSKGGGNYQTMINNVLKEHIVGREQQLEDSLRRILAEEIQKMLYARIHIPRFSETASNNRERTDIPLDKIELCSDTVLREAQTLMFANQ